MGRLQLRLQKYVYRKNLAKQLWASSKNKGKQAKGEKYDSKKQKQNEEKSVQERNKQLSWESNLDYLHGRSTSWPRRHAANDNIKWENFFPQVFFFASRLWTGYSTQDISDISL